MPGIDVKRSFGIDIKDGALVFYSNNTDNWYFILE